MSKKTHSLNSRQQTFIDEYLLYLDVFQAMLRSGHKIRPHNHKKYYVYFLANPLTNKIFYIGKGSNGRISSHAKEFRGGRTKNPIKALEIQIIINAGLEPTEVFFDAFESEAESYAVERHLIKELRGVGITNILGGIHTAEERMVADAKTMLGKLKPYNVWRAGLSESNREAVCKLWGGAWLCYDSLKRETEKIANREIDLTPWTKGVVVHA